MIDGAALLRYLDLIEDMNPEAHDGFQRVRLYVTELLKPLPTLREIEEGTDAAA